MSTDAKQKYLSKNYSQWVIKLRNSDFEKIEKIRKETGLSRADFLKKLVNKQYNVEFEEKGEFRVKKI